jgi:hypothetical protein
MKMNHSAAIWLKTNMLLEQHLYAHR